MKLWVDVEATRLAGEQLRQRAATRAPGPEAAAMKLAFATQARALSGLALQLEGEEGLRHDTWEMVRPTGADFNARGPGYRYLRAKGNSIEGGTSEVLRNILAERVLGLPSEPRVDKGIPFKEIPR